MKYISSHVLSTVEIPQKCVRNACSGFRDVDDLAEESERVLNSACVCVCGATSLLYYNFHYDYDFDCLPPVIATLLPSLAHQLSSRQTTYATAVQGRGKACTDEASGSIRRRSAKMTSLFSPGSSSYERLEGGMGPSRMSSGRRFGWKKFAIGAVVIIGLVWVFGPRSEDIIPEKYFPCESRFRFTSIAVC